MNVSKEEKKKWILENCISISGHIDLTGLDFDEFDGDVYLDGMKVKNSLYQSGHMVGAHIVQVGHSVQGNLFQGSQRVWGNLHGGNDSVLGDIYREDSKIAGTVLKTVKGKPQVTFSPFESKRNKEQINLELYQDRYATLLMELTPEQIYSFVKWSRPSSYPYKSKTKE